MLKRIPIPKTPLDRYLADIHYAVNAGALYSALALSLAIPDICGSIEYPGESQVHRRYGDWFDAWCFLHQSQMSAADCYAMRCSYLHSGSAEFAGPSAGYADLSHIQFTTGLSGGGWTSTFLPIGAPNTMPAVRIPVETFCRDMTTCANGWQVARTGDPRVAQALAQLLEIRPVGASS